jgi:hypothetical protein
MDKDSNIILNKNNIIIKKKDKNEYQIFYSVENHNIYLPKIINFTLMDIFYTLNKDIFEKYKIIIHNETNATIYILIKHFFCDLGISQKYICINVIIEKNNDLIIFKADTCLDTSSNKLIEEFNDKNNENKELLIIQNAIIQCKIINNHKIDLCSSMLLKDKKETPLFIENFASQIFNKIILRVKQFIENYA